MNERFIVEITTWCVYSKFKNQSSIKILFLFNQEISGPQTDKQDSGQSQGQSFQMSLPRHNKFSE